MRRAGLSVVLAGANSLLSKLKGEGLVGVIPEYEYPSAQCSELFPKKYGVLKDFVYASEGEGKWLDKVKWIAEEQSFPMENFDD